MSVDDGLRPLFRKHLRGCHWQTIERLLDRGVPDSNLCVDGREVWLEYKATRIWHVKIRPEQVGWLLTRERHGGVTVIATRRRRVRGRPDLDQLWLVRGWQARVFQEHGLAAWSDPAQQSDGLLGVWEGGPSQWDWDAVREVLRAQRREP
jgi:hypothetical protein